MCHIGCLSIPDIIIISQIVPTLVPADCPIHLRPGNLAIHLALIILTASEIRIAISNLIRRSSYGTLVILRNRVYLLG